jgi:signal peptidase I
MAGDRIFANKTYYNHRNPEYGDVVLFKNPEDRKINYIKRVVALSGDTVQLKDGQLLINGKLLQREWAQKKIIHMQDTPVEGDVFWEYNGDARYQILISKSMTDLNPQPEAFGLITVPAYHCFVMGDNRNYSMDSRNFGALSYGALEGRLTQIYWPIQHQASLDAANE